MSEFVAVYAIDPRDAVHLIPFTSADDPWVGRLSRGQGTREDAERAIRIFDSIGRTGPADRLRLALTRPSDDAAIDLDLVELRCRLRGWPCERTEMGIDVDTDDGPMWFQRDAYQVYDLHLHRLADILTAPRWTLDRLRASPPEGWVGAGLTLVWGEVVADTGRHEIEARVCSWEGRLGLGVECYGDAGPDELARYAVRLRAAAELALILAEVEP